MNAEVDQYLKKMKGWKAEIAKLREIVLETKLDEALKWGKPCYSFDGNNVAIFQPFKASLGMMFFKGMLFHFVPVSHLGRLLAVLLMAISFLSFAVVGGRVIALALARRLKR